MLLLHFKSWCLADSLHFFKAFQVLWELKEPRKFHAHGKSHGATSAWVMAPYPSIWDPHSISGKSRGFWSGQTCYRLSSAMSLLGGLAISLSLIQEKKNYRVHYYHRHRVTVWIQWDNECKIFSTVPRKMALYIIFFFKSATLVILFCIIFNSLCNRSGDIH